MTQTGTDVLIETEEPLVPLRLAAPGDEADLLAMCRALHEESGLRRAGDEPLAFSDDKALGLIRRAVVPFDGSITIGSGWCAIIGAPGRLEASIYITIEEPWYSREPFLAEMWNYVGRPFRRSAHANTLFVFAKGIADHLGIDPLVMGTLSTDRLPAKQRFYERQLGCRATGAFYLYHHAAGRTVAAAMGA
jgi:hypothetical protein